MLPWPLLIVIGLIAIIKNFADGNGSSDTNVQLMFLLVVAVAFYAATTEDFLLIIGW